MREKYGPKRAEKCDGTTNSTADSYVVLEVSNAPATCCIEPRQSHPTPQLCKHVCMHVHMHVCMHVWMFGYMYVCMHVIECDMTRDHAVTPP